MAEHASRDGSEESGADRARRLAGRAADAAVGVIAGADAVVRQAGFTTRDGRISKAKLAVAALHPRSSGRRLIKAAAIEIDRRRNGTGSAPGGR